MAARAETSAGLGDKSPEQITQRPSLDFPLHEFIRIIHEGICQALYVQNHGAIGQDLVACRGGALPVSRASSRRTVWANVAPATLTSQGRPEVADRAVPGRLT